MTSTVRLISSASASGCLLGMAVGDAMGLPYEGLTPDRARRLLGEPVRPRFLFGRGMVSDDTEHACLTAAALIRSGGQPERFARELARGMRWWMASLPGGIGLATARAILRLWVGFPPHRSGVPSAGNGPAMRAPILGASVESETDLLTLVDVSSRITHADPRAIEGARLVALAARLAARDPGLTAATFGLACSERGLPSDPDFRRLLDAATASAAARENTSSFAAAQGMRRGVSGFVVHTVPVAIHAWLTHRDDLQGAVRAAIQCGGDADTVAAIAGGIVGSATGPEGVPSAWLTGLLEGPRGVAWMRRLAAEAAEAGTTRVPGDVPAHSWPLIPLRNALFLAVVLVHGLRRLLPPYR